MPSDEESNRLREEVSADEEIGATFRRLRRDGHSRLDALRLVLDALDVSLSEAKTLLLTHETWAEAHRAADQRTEPPGDEAYDDPVPPAPA